MHTQLHKNYYSFTLIVIANISLVYKNTHSISVKIKRPRLVKLIDNNIHFSQVNHDKNNSVMSLLNG